MNKKITTENWYTEDFTVFIDYGDNSKNEDSILLIDSISSINSLPAT